ncbi:phospholipase D-like domain-containing protein [Oleiagrimonas sp. C23AA]|uniref:phospholipase D-like domain-containing protein n=1 Tax=Oleiagrimonas sp. C23AA TaxID=2719047 RepID=UPI001421216B|nr:phospholipase D-like domain-containing protein [Oleiagrimonas sp. C23AA]NII09956.1 cardiolipin synthase B [Oleiagrimonas sp. C23AA]
MRVRHRLLIRSGYLLAGIILTLVITLLVMNLLPQEKQLSRPLQGIDAVHSTQFRHEVASVLGEAVHSGNQVTDLQNGKHIFPAMLDAIDHAQYSINMEAYIFWSGHVMHKFVDALTSRARAGVKVHVLADWIGARNLDDKVVRQLRAGGVKFEYFHPLHWYDIDRLNNRTHRRLLIVDGKVAFTGGVGIADSWGGEARSKGHWRDMQFRVTGPAAAQLQAVFEDNWITTTGHVLLGPHDYPLLKRRGDMDAQVFSSSPEGGSENMQLMYLMAIDGARQSIDLEAAYFVPDRLTIRALKRAIARGVKVRIVLPGKDDAGFVLGASKHSWGPMLKAGAQLYRYQPSKFHCKMMIVDHYLTIVGSANFDNRSFKLNDEVNLNVYNAGFARHMTQVVDQDIAHARRYTLADWKARPWHTKLYDRLAALTDPLL